ncbi:hypothetical protein N9034_01165 [bacterium]|nr:hypothetical protein [bacterium]MDB4489768.1 hypothetical protein [bacterium]
MALPSSGPISGSQISAELGTASTNISLGGMSDSASLIAPDAYSDFYGYSSLTSFIGSAFQSKNKLICSQTQNVTFYHDGSNTWPAVGDTVYTNSGGTTPGVGYSRVNFGYILTNSSGVVTNNYLCFL